MSKRLDDALAFLNRAMEEFGLGVDEETPEDGEGEDDGRPQAG